MSGAPQGGLERENSTIAQIRCMRSAENPQSLSSGDLLCHSKPDRTNGLDQGFPARERAEGTLLKQCYLSGWERELSHLLQTNTMSDDACKACTKQQEGVVEKRVLAPRRPRKERVLQLDGYCHHPITSKDSPQALAGEQASKRSGQYGLLTSGPPRLRQGCERPDPRQPRSYRYDDTSHLQMHGTGVTTM
jgi:hypothetical protein